MALETEIKLSLPPRAAAQLAVSPPLAGIKPLRQRLLNTYYDTPDLRLQRERIAVRYRKKGWEWLLTVKSAAPSAGGLARRNEWEVAGLPGEFDFSHVDDAKLRHLLESLRHELIPVFTTDFTRSAWLLEPRTGVRIELALDRGWIEAQERRAAICELELELLEGDVDALFAAASLLLDELPLHPEAASKAERGYRLFADAPLQWLKAQPAALDAEMSTVAAFRAVALACLSHLQGNEQGVAESEAPEFIHQARVAIRRLRSAIRVWKPQLPADFVSRFDLRWRALANALGEARNWDVFVTETLPPLAEAFPAHAEIDRLARHAHRRSASSRKSARTALKATDYSRLLLEFTAAVLALPEDEAPTLKAFARRCLNKRAKRVAALSAEAQSAGAAARHRLRVALKRLRYALEFFAQLFPGRRLPSYHQAVTRLQDLLGRLNDLEIATQLAGEALPGAKGELIRGWLGGRKELMLHELDDALADFRQQQAPWKVR